MLLNWGQIIESGVLCNGAPIGKNLFLASQEGCPYLGLALAKKDRLQVVPTRSTGDFSRSGVNVARVESLPPFYVLQTTQSLVNTPLLTQWISLPSQPGPEQTVLGFPGFEYNDRFLRFQKMSFFSSQGKLFFNVATHQKASWALKRGALVIQEKDNSKLQFLGLAGALSSTSAPDPALPRFATRFLPLTDLCPHKDHVLLKELDTLREFCKNPPVL